VASVMTSFLEDLVPGRMDHSHKKLCRYPLAPCGLPITQMMMYPHPMRPIPPNLPPLEFGFDCTLADEIGQPK